MNACQQPYHPKCPSFQEITEVMQLFRTWMGDRISIVYGGFQLLDLIIPELKSHVIPYKFTGFFHVLHPKLLMLEI